MFGLGWCQVGLVVGRGAGVFLGEGQGYLLTLRILRAYYATGLALNKFTLWDFVQQTSLASSSNSCHLHTTDTAEDPLSLRTDRQTPAPRRVPPSTRMPLCLAILLPLSPQHFRCPFLSSMVNPRSIPRYTDPPASAHTFSSGSPCLRIRRRETATYECKQGDSSFQLVWQGQDEEQIIQRTVDLYREEVPSVSLLPPDNMASDQCQSLLQPLLEQKKQQNQRSRAQDQLPTLIPHYLLSIGPGYQAKRPGFPFPRLSPTHLHHYPNTNLTLTQRLTASS